MQKRSLALIFSLLTLGTLTMPLARAAEPARLVIMNVKGVDKLGAREARVARDIDVAQLLRERLTDSRTFWVVARDNETVQTIIGERELETLDDAPGTPADLSLDTADYVLEPTLKLTLVTTYRALPLLDDMFMRDDRVEIELAVRILNRAGSQVFEDRRTARVEYGEIEANAEARARNAVRDVAPIRQRVAALADGIVGAVVERVNPITILSVQSDTFRIDRGRDNGFDKNTRFIVFGPSRTIKHPRTGEMIEDPGVVIGEAQVVAIYERQADLKLVTGDHAAVTFGALVKIKE